MLVPYGFIVFHKLNIVFFMTDDSMTSTRTKLFTTIVCVFFLEKNVMMYKGMMSFENV